MKILLIATALLTATSAVAAPPVSTRDCTKPPYGASEENYTFFKDYLSNAGANNPEETLQKVCIGQTKRVSEQRESLMFLGFTTEQIEESDTANLALAVYIRIGEILKRQKQDKKVKNG